MLRAASRLRFRCRRCRILDRSCGTQNGDDAGGARSSEILRQSDRVAGHLPLACFAADLLDDITDLTDAGRAHRMPFGFEAAAGIDGTLAMDASFSSQCIWPALAFGNKSEIFDRDDFRNGKAVVHLRELDVGR